MYSRFLKPAAALIFLVCTLSGQPASLYAQPSPQSGPPQPGVDLRWGHPAMPRSGACFYKDLRYGGDFFCIPRGQSVPSLPGGFNDRITSIRVMGGSSVRIFNGANFNEPSIRFRSNVPDLRRIPLPNDPRRNWNDRISSIAVR